MTNFQVNIPALQAKFNRNDLENLQEFLNLFIEQAFDKHLFTKDPIKGYYQTPMLDDESSVNHTIIELPNPDNDPDCTLYDSIIQHFREAFYLGDPEELPSKLRNDYDQGPYVSFSTPCEVIQFFPCDCYLHVIYICTGQF